MGDVKLLAQQIAERLFTNGQGQEATRLVLELADKREGGGWCRKAVEDQIAKAIDARISAAGEMAWRLFDSAPTDGTEVLVWRKDAGMFTAAFLPSAGDDGEYGPQMNGDECWFDAAGNDLGGDLPTHWMPKPASPAASPLTGGCRE